MIADKLENAAFYSGLDPLIVAGLEFLKRPDLADLEEGRHDIQGDDLFALVMKYQTKHLAYAIFESHQKYHDIQYIISGSERIGVTNIGNLKIGEYEDDRDFQNWSGSGELIRFDPGMFFFFAPWDGHAPGLVVDGPETVHKVVVKVRVS